MKSIFSEKNPIIKLLTLICNLIILNFVIILTSLPIFTIGASLSAAYRTIYVINTQPNPSIIASYVNSFKENFKKSTVVWLFLLIGFLFVFSDLYIIFFIIDKTFLFLQFPAWIIFFVLISFILYCFPILSCYDYTDKHLAKNVILISLANMPITFTFVVIHAALLFIASSSLYAFAVTLFFFIIIGFAFILYIFSTFIFNALNKCIREE